ncbi:MAG: hypothetical protein ACPGVU_01475 [Limisphaerales bacterium]
MRRIVSFIGLFVVAHGIFGAKLPQDYPWQKTLRAYLATLPEEAFLITDLDLTFPKDYATNSTDRIYRDWIILGNFGREPITAAFRAKPRHFVLSAIEGDQIRSFPGPAALAWWIRFDYPGNPFAASQAGMRRALVIAMVDMLMLETAHAMPFTIKPDFMAANIGTWAYTYSVCRALLPGAIQAAYREGIYHHFKLMERMAPRDGNSNMDMRGLATLAELDHVFAEAPGFHQRAIRLARRILFGAPDRGPTTTDPRRGTFHRAGYIGEADGPETSYNGISMFHLTEAAMLTRGEADWDAFMPEVIRRMVRFRAYNTFPEPDGSFDGPSSWSTRTNDPYTHDQRDRPWRRYAEAMLTDEALFRLGIHPDHLFDRSRGHPDRTQMLDDIEKAVARLNARPRPSEGWHPDSPPVWKEHHWPNDIPYTFDQYVPGSHAKFAKSVTAKSPLLLAPFAREGDFNESFDEEFWMAKRGDWGFQVEAVPHMSRSYDKGGSGALAGGSLAAFWTRQSGLILLGRLPDKWNHVTWDKIETWPTHHLWGRTKEGTAFSSARQWHPWTRFEPGQHPKTVHVHGYLGPRQTVEQEDSIDSGHVYYRRRFELKDDGLHISSEILSRGQDEVREIWETIPVFLNPTRRPTTPDTTIELHANGRWQPATTAPTAGVTALRMKRFAGGVQLYFTQPQRIAVGDPFETAYQKKDRFRLIRVDLLRGQDRMPIKAVVSYRITAEK